MIANAEQQPARRQRGDDLGVAPVTLHRGWDGGGQAVDQGGDPAGSCDGAGEVEPADSRGVSASTVSAASATAMPIGTLTNSTHCQET